MAPDLRLKTRLDILLASPKRMARRFRRITASALPVLLHRTLSTAQSAPQSFLVLHPNLSLRRPKATYV